MGYATILRKRISKPDAAEFIRDDVASWKSYMRMSMGSVPPVKVEDTDGLTKMSASYKEGNAHFKWEVVPAECSDSGFDRFATAFFGKHCKGKRVDFKWSDADSLADD